MFLSRLFSIFKKKKDPEQQTSGDSGAKGSNVVTPGTIAGGAAASSGLSDQNAEAPNQQVADVSGQTPGAGNTINPQEDTSSSDNTQTVAQTDGAPSYPGEEPSLSTPEESTEAISTPDAESYQSGSTDDSIEEPKLPPDDSSPQPPESEPTSPEDSSDDPNQDDQSAGGSAGPSIG